MDRFRVFMFAFMLISCNVFMLSCGSDDGPDASETCTDGIQNQDETAIDCGGSCDPCTAAPTCTDGIQNGDETGVDCGGSCDSCTATPTCTDGLQNGDETGVDCGGSCDPCSTNPTCTDGIQNGDETGIDCGGSCDPCVADPTCFDGLQNGDETGIDCGGSCDPCTAEPTCFDGIQNGDETGIDCGGSCDPCVSEPTCNDGIQNGNETGVDCGGSCPPCNMGFFEHITADINGQPYAANLVQGFDDGTFLEINSDQSQPMQISFDLFSSSVAVGATLDIDQDFNLAFFVDFPDSYDTESGSVTITGLTEDAGELGGNSYDELSGTFEFTAIQYSFGTPIDTVIITNGSFGVEVF